MTPTLEARTLGTRPPDPRRPRSPSFRLRRVDDDERCGRREPGELDLRMPAPPVLCRDVLSIRRSEPTRRATRGVTAVEAIPSPTGGVEPQPLGLPSLSRRVRNMGVE